MALPTLNSHSLIWDGVQDSVRVGDIFALLIETHVLHGRLEVAGQLLARLKSMIPVSGVRYYISEQLLEALGESLGDDAGNGPARTAASSPGAEVMDEEVPFEPENV